MPILPKYCDDDSEFGPHDGHIVVSSKKHFTVISPACCRLLEEVPYASCSGNYKAGLNSKCSMHHHKDFPVTEK